MNLYLFPEAANNNNGYGFAVERDFQRIQPQEDDMIVWYTISERKDIGHLKDKDIIIKKNTKLSTKSFCNIILGRERTEIKANELQFLKGHIFNSIFCGDTIFYNAIRKLFPDTPIIVRFHNCFARIHDRKKLIKTPLDWKFNLKLRNMYKLERNILNDSNTYKIFISDEDRDYYTSMFGQYEDSETWIMKVDTQQIKNKRVSINYSNKIVWFGGIESHKESSVLWFIKDILPKIKEKIKNIEFHLWGRGTNKFNDNKNGIYAHGYYKETGFPTNNALYINPDLIGGGVKIKLATLIEEGIPFISTPFGFEGYPKELIDNNYCIVVEKEKWVETIIRILTKHN